MCQQIDSVLEKREDASIFAEKLLDVLTQCGKLRPQLALQIPARVHQLHVHRLWTLGRARKTGALFQRGQQLGAAAFLRVVDAVVRTFLLESW